MSASKNKKIRKEQLESGVNKRAAAAAKEAADRRKSNIKYTVIGVAVVLILAVLLLLNSAWAARNITAVTIDGEDYSAAELNYYYSSSYMNFYNTYAYYMDAGLFFDSTQSLGEQEYMDGMTWRDYFMETAVSTMTQVQLLNDAAEEAGFVLPEEYEAQYAETVESFKTEWALYGYSSLEQYINLSYGKGVTMEILETELYRNFVASAYSEAIFNGYEYSTAELDAYYAEHAGELDTITYTYVSSTDGSMDVNAIAAAVNGTDEEGFHTYMHENYEGTEPTTLTNAGSNLSTVYGEWLLDAARQPGDATAIESESGASYAVMFLDRNDNNYPTVNFRHILINAEDTDADGAYSAEEIAAAQAEAEALYAEWQAGEATEDSFAALANTMSDDGGSNTTGGLYELVYQDAMVAPVNDWIFDAARQTGDTGIVSYEGSNYTGTHILYFAGADELTYAQYQADQALRNEAYSAWLEELTAAASAETKSLFLSGKHI